MRDSHILMFDAFRVALLDERLWRGEEAIHLTNKAFSVLRYLLDHPAQLVPKEALFEAGWPDTYVSDAVLTVWFVVLATMSFPSATIGETPKPCPLLYLPRFLRHCSLPAWL